METKTIRVSLGSLVLALIILAAIGIMGGYIGTRIFPPQQPLISGDDRSIIPIAQQVVISPNKSAQENVSQASRSIYLLAETASRGITPLGSATAITNDGILMTTVDATGDGLLAIGENGQSMQLSPIGTDALTGISFLKASGQIVTPLEMAQNAPRPGEMLLAPYRQPSIAQIATASTMMSGTTLPSDSYAPGLQKLAQLTAPVDVPSGTPLLDDAGTLAGMLIDPENGTAIVISDIRSALDRLSSGSLAKNPFADLGFTVSWRGQVNEVPSITIASVVDSVAQNGNAAKAGMRAGDVITAVGGNTLTWDTPLTPLLSPAPSTITVMRQGEQQTLSFAP